MAETRKIGLIFLGASEYPKSNNFQSSSAFLESYNRIKQYFIESGNLSIAPAHFLDLFDTELAPSDIDDNISMFLAERIETDKVTDLIVYYIGHGGFDNNQGYLLAIKKTKDDAKAVSSLLLKDLSNRIAKSAQDLRTYLIFDCCFSGEAAKQFQASSSNEVLATQFKEAFPPIGISMLCSSSRDLPSIIVQERNITMFTEGLEKALLSGTTEITNNLLTLRELRNLTYAFIKQLNIGEDVKPEVHSPGQAAGDIADFPLFPNLAQFKKSYDLTERTQAIERLIIENNMMAAIKSLMDLTRNFTLGEELEGDTTLLAMECGDFDIKKDKFERAELRYERRFYYKEMLRILSQVKLQHVD